MIKFLLFLIYFLYSFNSHAITLGSSLGLKIGSAKLNTKENQILNKNQNDYNFNIGTFYKYNWNIRKFFIGVEIIYDFLNVKNSLSSVASVDFRYRYSANLNLGYDIYKNISIYGLVGASMLKYKAKINTDNLTKKNHTEFTPIFGVGIGYDFSPSWKMNLEYNRQTLNIILDNNYSQYKFKNRLELLSLSVIYKF